MAGEAKSEKFMLGSATVMIGPQADLFNLNPDEHSIGLVKNFTISGQPAYTELTQGVKNSVVYSVMTGNPVTATMEVFEHTSKNLAYGLGLDGSALTPSTVKTTLNADVPANAAGADTLPVASAAGFAVGDWIQAVVPGYSDRMLVAKVKTIDSTAKTLQVVSSQKFDYQLPNGTVVQKVNVVGIGSKANQPFLAAKVVGNLADNTPVALLIPKIRITGGFTLAFKTDAFGNLPYKFQPYDLVSTDPFYDDFLPFGQAMLASAN
ncbi:hypothetical protein DF044_01975 [Burkholderia contaminans]|uniref:hypothetical protein n=2 Tax=Burkholderia TaxID=32008 RepID=UPI000348B6AF|nr:MULTISPECIES: hypothetical protein [Burkholderia]MBF3563856.1 hypothetical protein [Burkholderia pseudomallei]MBF3800053.1 hypothetical protein [Burkholderia pseudomallei]MBF3843906.1 hypothetical protein [Burkholderia pseudomallei]RQT19456.1 hypothetical protein DF044_01975 [Burkholderia contaminans]CAJ3204547.1 Uncharacterised protein [Burkholderia pseudomallei]